MILGFATIGFFLLYLGFRYNALFTLGTNASTRGESYVRALKQLTVGIYLSEVCLIGLFAIGVASNTQSIGPLVLMIVFLIATIAWQIWLDRTLKKMELDMPEESLIAEKDGGYITKEEYSQQDTKSASAENGDELAHTPTTTSSGNVGMMARFKAYFTETADVAAQNALAHVAPHLGGSARGYTQQEHDEAYVHPAIISECPIVWIARDSYGVSQQEVAATTSEQYRMTDEGAVFNAKGKVEWRQQESLREAPIWEEDVAY